jgi:hypothetical protein
MSEKPQKSAKGKAIDRPFSPAVLAKAKKITGQYEAEGGGRKGEGGRGTAAAGAGPQR